MIYNELQKMRYAKQSDMPESSFEVYKQILATAAKVELQEGTDLANFNRAQVIRLLKTYNSRSRQYLRLISNYFANYYDWCVSERLVDVTNITNWYEINLVKPIISEVLPNELIEGKFFDKETLLMYIDMIKDVSNKLLAYAPFFGIDGESHNDLIHLDINMLDEEKKTIKLYSGLTVKVDDVFIDLIKQANQSQRYDKEGLGQYDVRNSNVYTPSKYVFKVCRSQQANAVLNAKSINTRFATIKEQTGNKMLSMGLIYKNGLLNHIKEYYEQIGVTLSDALFGKAPNSKRSYLYDEKTQELIEEFGSRMTVRMLRMQMTDIIHYYE